MVNGFFFNTDNEPDERTHLAKLVQSGLKKRKRYKREKDIRKTSAIFVCVHQKFLWPTSTQILATRCYWPIHHNNNNPKSYRAPALPPEPHRPRTQATRITSSNAPDPTPYASQQCPFAPQFQPRFPFSSYHPLSTLFSGDREGE